VPKLDFFPTGFQQDFNRTLKVSTGFQQDNRILTGQQDSNRTKLTFFNFFGIKVDNDVHGHTGEFI